MLCPSDLTFNISIENVFARIGEVKKDYKNKKYSEHYIILLNYYSEHGRYIYVIKLH